MAEIRAQRRTTVMPRSVQHIKVEARLDPRTLAKGCEGIVESGNGGTDRVESLEQDRRTRRDDNRRGKHVQKEDKSEGRKSGRIHACQGGR